MQVNARANYRHTKFTLTRTELYATRACVILIIYRIMINYT